MSLTSTARVITRTPTLEECQQVRVWRNDPAVLPMLRTGFKTEAEQTAFYHDVVCTPSAPHRYYALEHESAFIGLGGLTYLDRIPGQAEISLILGPAFRGRGLGSAAVDVLLRAAFGRLGLRTVIGECYAANLAIGFWAKLVATRPEVTTFEYNGAGSLLWTWSRRP